MAQDIKVKVRLDDGQFKSQLNENDNALDNFSNSVSEASQKVSEAAQKQVRAAEGMGNYRRELRNTVKSIQNLSFAYAELSDADKQSDVGRAMLARLNELKQRGAELKDTITDINNEIKNMASDTSGFDALRESIQIGSSIMSAFVSSMQLAGTETE